MSGRAPSSSSSSKAAPPSSPSSPHLRLGRSAIKATKADVSPPAPAAGPASNPVPALAFPTTSATQLALDNSGDDGERGERVAEGARTTGAVGEMYLRQDLGSREGVAEAAEGQLVPSRKARPSTTGGGGGGPPLASSGVLASAAATSKAELQKVQREVDRLGLENGRLVKQLEAKAAELAKITNEVKELRAKSGPTRKSGRKSQQAGGPLSPGAGPLSPAAQPGSSSGLEAAGLPEPGGGEEVAASGDRQVQEPWSSRLEPDTLVLQSRVADLEAQLQLAQRDLQAAKEQLQQPPPSPSLAEVALELECSKRLQLLASMQLAPGPPTAAPVLSAAQEQVGPRLQQLLEECGCQVKPGSEGEEGAGQPAAGLVQQLQALQGLLQALSQQYSAGLEGLNRAAPRTAQAPGLRLGAEELQCLLANSDAKLAQLKGLRLPLGPQQSPRFDRASHPPPSPRAPPPYSQRLLAWINDSMGAHATKPQASRPSSACLPSSSSTALPYAADAARAEVASRRSGPTAPASLASPRSRMATATTDARTKVVEDRASLGTQSQQQGLPTQPGIALDDSSHLEVPQPQLCGAGITPQELEHDQPGGDGATATNGVECMDPPGILFDLHEEPSTGYASTGCDEPRSDAAEVTPKNISVPSAPAQAVHVALPSPPLLQPSSPLPRPWSIAGTPASGGSSPALTSVRVTTVGAVGQVHHVLTRPLTALAPSARRLNAAPSANPGRPPPEVPGLNLNGARIAGSPATFGPSTKGPTPGGASFERLHASYLNPGVFSLTQPAPSEQQHPDTQQQQQQQEQRQQDEHDQQQQQTKLLGQRLAGETAQGVQAGGVASGGAKWVPGSRPASASHSDHTTWRPLITGGGGGGAGGGGAGARASLARKLQPHSLPPPGPCPPHLPDEPLQPGQGGAVDMPLVARQQGGGAPPGIRHSAYAAPVEGPPGGAFRVRLLTANPQKGVTLPHSVPPHSFPSSPPHTANPHHQHMSGGGAEQQVGGGGSPRAVGPRGRQQGGQQGGEAAAAAGGVGRWGGGYMDLGLNLEPGEGPPQVIGVVACPAPAMLKEVVGSSSGVAAPLLTFSLQTQPGASPAGGMLHIAGDDRRQYSGIELMTRNELVMAVRGMQAQSEQMYKRYMAAAEEMARAEAIRAELAGEVAEARQHWVAENQYNAMLQEELERMQGILEAVTHTASRPNVSSDAAHPGGGKRLNVE
ncbi:hypothetical protein QJQ45_015019 [Haematococcus lacustris]|nr:hypothetical protein QJQ45_015019 [Haematococcus lacustris]